MVFRLDDPEHELTPVRLWEELGLPAESLDFDQVDGGWELRLPRPTVHRMEYLFEVTGADGEHAMSIDPSNPRLVGGAVRRALGARLPGLPRAGLARRRAGALRAEPLAVDGSPLGTVELQVWSPADADPAEPLPLLVSHDGPEFAAYAGLTHYAGAMVADEELPRMRLALVTPGPRNAWYAANLGLRRRAHPRACCRRCARCTRPTTTGADGRQPGRARGAARRVDAPGHVRRAVPAVGLVLHHATPTRRRRSSPDFARGHRLRAPGARRDRRPRARRPWRMTCGSAEENVHNNRVMAAQLSELGLGGGVRRESRRAQLHGLA